MSSEVVLEHRRFTAEEVARMVEAGILREDEPVELIGGELIVVSPQGPLHTTIVQRVNQRLSLLFGGRAHTRIQFPIHVPPDGLPEPDLAVVRGSIDDYSGRHPNGEDLILVVEVAVTSLATDRAKAAEYARAGAPVYWLLDVGGRRLEIYTQPEAKTGRYSVTTILDDTRAVEVPQTSSQISVAELLKR